MKFNDGKHIETIVQRQSCTKHKALLGAPCWNIYPSIGGALPAVCNDRILKAGFVGDIQPSSLRKRQ